MRLRAWARLQGIHYQTAYRWFRDGKMPVSALRLPSGGIWVEEGVPRPTGVALYARVSGHDQRDELTRQLGRLVEWAAERKLKVTHAVGEVGSGMNGSRPKLRRLLADPKVGTIVVEHRDRLARLGSEYVEAALWGSGRQLVVVDRSDFDDDLVRDMTEVLTSLCARLYDRRSARTRAARALRRAAENV